MPRLHKRDDGFYTVCLNIKSVDVIKRLNAQANKTQYILSLIKSDIKREERIKKLARGEI